MISAESPYIVAAIHLGSMLVIWLFSWAARLLYQGYRKDPETNKRQAHISVLWYRVGIVCFTIFSIVHYSGTAKIMLSSTNMVDRLQVYTGYIMIMLIVHSILSGTVIIGYRRFWKLLGIVIVFVGCYLNIFIL